MSLYPIREATSRENWMFLNRRREELVADVKADHARVIAQLGAVNDPIANIAATACDALMADILKTLTTAGFREGGYL